MSVEKEKVLAFLAEENFRILTRRLISHRKQGNLKDLQEIYNGLDLVVESDERACFFKLLKLIHPDRLKWHHNRYQTALEKKDQSLLNWYRLFSRIQFPGSRIRKDPTAQNVSETYQYSNEDFDQSFESSYRHYQNLWIHEEEQGGDFLQAVNELFLGNHQLNIAQEELELLTGDLDLSSRGISSLKGIEHLRMIDILNLSDNQLDRISGLDQLYNLKELYISGNSLTDLSGLEPLHSLEFLDASENELEDISGIFGLENLEAVNLQGNNHIPEEQLLYLKDKGVLIIYSHSS